MKKLFVTALIAMMILTGGAIAAYADDVSPTPVATESPTPEATPSSTPEETEVPTPETTPTEIPQSSETPVPTGTPETSVTPVPTSTPGKIDKNDPLYIELQKKNEYRMELVKQQNELALTIAAKDRENIEIVKDIKDKFRLIIKAIEDQIKDIYDNQIVPLKEKRAEVLKELAKAHRRNDKEAIARLNKELKEINNEIKEKYDEIRELKDIIKEQNTELKELKEKLKEASLELKDIQIQINKLHKDILKLRIMKDAEWVRFTEAMWRADLVDANLHMDNIIKYKTEIIEKMNEILKLKQQIEEVLSEVVE